MTAAFVVLCWYYNERDGRTVFPELSATFGPFADETAADAWIKTQSGWGGWGRYEYQITPLHPPEAPE